MKTITFEDVERLADELEADEESKRERLVRLIKAHARIVAVREPAAFKARCVEIADEDGHYDNSFPPDIEWKDPSGPRSVRVRKADYDTVATEGGFYHDWRAVTADPGLHVARDGRILGATFTGTGHLGQFAAQPGNCNVHIEVEYSERDDVSTEELVAAEAHMRRLAFPLSQAA